MLFGLFNRNSTIRRILVLLDLISFVQISMKKLIHGDYVATQQQCYTLACMMRYVHICLNLTHYLQNYMCSTCLQIMLLMDWEWESVSLITGLAHLGRIRCQCRHLNELGLN